MASEGTISRTVSRDREGRIWVTVDVELLVPGVNSYTEVPVPAQACIVDARCWVPNSFEGAITALSPRIVDFAPYSGNRGSKLHEFDPVSGMDLHAVGPHPMFTGTGMWVLFPFADNPGGVGSKVQWRITYTNGCWP